MLPPSQGINAKVSQKLGLGTLNPQGDGGAALVGFTLQAFMQHFNVYSEQFNGYKLQQAAWSPIHMSNLLHARNAH